MCLGPRSSRVSGCGPSLSFSNSSSIFLLPKPKHESLSLVHSCQFLSRLTPSSLSSRLNVTFSKRPSLTPHSPYLSYFPYYTLTRLHTLPSSDLLQVIVLFYSVVVVCFISVYLTKLYPAVGQHSAHCYTPQHNPVPATVDSDSINIY